MQLYNATQTLWFRFSMILDTGLQFLLPPGGYSYILAIWVCAAGEGMVFKPFGLVEGMVFKPFGLV